METETSTVYSCRHCNYRTFDKPASYPKCPACELGQRMDLAIDFAARQEPGNE